jgi:hypothetical protein
VLIRLFARQPDCDQKIGQSTDARTKITKYIFRIRQELPYVSSNSTVYRRALQIVTNHFEVAAFSANVSVSCVIIFINVLYTIIDNLLYFFDGLHIIIYKKENHAFLRYTEKEIITRFSNIIL